MVTAAATASERTVLEVVQNLQAILWERIEEGIQKLARTLVAQSLEGEASLPDEEAARLESAIRRLGDQQRRLVRLYRFAEIDDAFIKREAEQLKRQKAGLEAELAGFQR